MCHWIEIDSNACLLDHVQPQPTQFNGHRGSVDLFEKTIAKRVIDCVEPLDDRFCYVLKFRGLFSQKKKISVYLRTVVYYSTLLVCVQPSASRLPTVSSHTQIKKPLRSLRAPRLCGDRGLNVKPPRKPKCFCLLVSCPLPPASLTPSPSLAAPCMPCQRNHPRS